MTFFQRSRPVGSRPTVLLQGSTADGQACPIRALRAEWPVRLATRARLAGDWEHLLDEVGKAGPTPSYRIPICRNRVLSSEAEIQG